MGPNQEPFIVFMPGHRKDQFDLAPRSETFDIDGTIHLNRPPSYTFSNLQPHITRDLPSFMSAPSSQNRPRASLDALIPDNKEMRSEKTSGEQRNAEIPSLQRILSISTDKHGCLSSVEYP